MDQLSKKRLCSIAFWAFIAAVPTRPATKSVKIFFMLLYIYWMILLECAKQNIKPLSADSLKYMAQKYNNKIIFTCYNG